jgi:hypothetical protein
MVMMWSSGDAAHGGAALGESIVQLLHRAAEQWMEGLGSDLDHGSENEAALVHGGVGDCEAGSLHHGAAE